MKKEIKQSVKRVKQSYGIEETVAEPTEPLLDLETIKHQRFTDRIVSIVDYSSMAIIYGSSLAYGIYRAIQPLLNY